MNDDWPAEQARRIRRHKVEAMLEAFDLKPDDFLAWLGEQPLDTLLTRSTTAKAENADAHCGNSG